VKIKLLPDTDLVALAELAVSQGSIFNSAAWLSNYDSSLKVYGIYTNDNKLIGSFHLFTTQLGGLLTHCKNPPFTPHIGLFFLKQSSTKSTALSFEKSIATCLVDFLDSLSYPMLTLALPNEFIDLQAFIWKKYKVIPNYTYRLNLDQDIDELLKNLSGDKRTSINKAAKDNVKIEFCTDLQEVKRMVENTYTRKAKQLNAGILDKILFQFAKPENSFAFLAHHNNSAAALSFCIYDKTTAYYLLGGYATNNKHQGAGVLALWNCILHAKKLGLKTFDFEGSMIPQVEKYFRGFGGDLIPYFTVNKANFLLETGLKFIKRDTF
jgi:hypothetical protein